MIDGPGGWPLPGDIGAGPFMRRVTDALAAQQDRWGVDVKRFRIGVSWERGSLILWFFYRVNPQIYFAISLPDDMTDLDRIESTDIDEMAADACYAVSSREKVA